MTKLDELLQIDGVMAAGEFAPDGSIIGYRTNRHMTPETAASCAQFCASVTMMFSTLAGALSQTTQMSWTPQRGWSYSGGELTVVVGGHYGVFIRTDTANVNTIFTALMG
jgi:roadblock/LC7 domain-containing protein